jgi:hypothetical protein
VTREERIKEIEEGWAGTGDDRDFLLSEVKRLETENAEIKSIHSLIEVIQDYEAKIKTLYELINKSQKENAELKGPEGLRKSYRDSRELNRTLQSKLDKAARVLEDLRFWAAVANTKMLDSDNWSGDLVLKRAEAALAELQRGKLKVHGCKQIEEKDGFYLSDKSICPFCKEKL